MRILALVCFFVFAFSQAILPQAITPTTKLTFGYMLEQKLIATGLVALEHILAGQLIQQARFADALLADDADFREGRRTVWLVDAKKFNQKIFFERPRFAVDQIKNVGQFLFNVDA